MEIDAASNSGVENIRQIIDCTHIIPINSRYKVFVLDEVHSLSSHRTDTEI